MSILVKPNTKVLIQGITGSFGAKHAQLSIDYGTQIVAGVTPGKGGQIFEHAGRQVPIFDTVADAVKQTGATVSAIFVPPPFAADAILEGADAGLDLVVGHHRRHSRARHGPRQTRAGRQQKRGSSDRTVPASSRPAKARIPTAAAASASRPVTFTKKETSASSRAAAR